MPEFTDAQAIDAYWQGEYEFYRKIITDEVERLRFNDGYEPVTVELHPVKKNVRREPDYVGRTQIGHQHFRAEARWSFDSEGKKILKLQIRPEP